MLEMLEHAVDSIDPHTFRETIKDPEYYDACNSARKDLHAIQLANDFAFLKDPEWN